MATRFLRPEDICQSVLVSSELGRHAGWLHGYVELGFEKLHLHQIGRNQQDFIEAFGSRVLAQLGPTR